MIDFFFHCQVPSHENKPPLSLVLSSLKKNALLKKKKHQHLLAPSARGNLTILLNATCVACKFVQSAVRKVREGCSDGVDEREREERSSKRPAAASEKEKKGANLDPPPPSPSRLLPSLSLSSHHHNALQAGLAGVLGLAGGPQNVQGEDQKKLDVLANDVFISCLGRSGQVAAMVSEEDDAPIVVEGSPGGYVVVFDPLDGSSNIDCGVSIGTIFGIYRKEQQQQQREEGGQGAGSASTSCPADPAPPPPSSSSPPSSSPAEAALRPGRDLVAAGYCLYGSSCMLVLCVGESPPSVFTLDPSLGEFVLTQGCVRVPERGSIYSINEGNALLWDRGTAKYVEKCKGLGGSSGGGGGGGEEEEVAKSCEVPKSARYVGSMVADVHRTLLYGTSLSFCSRVLMVLFRPFWDARRRDSRPRNPEEREKKREKIDQEKISPFFFSSLSSNSNSTGGVFCYPADRKSKDGKLRLLYEGAPMVRLFFFSFFLPKREQRRGKKKLGRKKKLTLSFSFVFLEKKIQTGSNHYGRGREGHRRPRRRCPGPDADELPR